MMSESESLTVSGTRHSKSPRGLQARWLEEPDVLLDSFQVKLKMEKVLYEARTQFQKCVIFENKIFGRVLALDDICQTTENDEFCYHEMLVHVPMFTHPKPRRVLIIGGGDGGALEEVLKHSIVERVTMVEIDPSVIDLSKKYLPSICGEAFEDPRLDLVITDGVKFVHETEERFDVIIVDSTDPVGPGVVLFQPHFYKGCRRVMNVGGLLVQQNATPFVEREWLQLPIRGLKNVFEIATCYVGAVPTFYGGLMAYTWATNSSSLMNTPLETLRERYNRMNFSTQYYTPEIHRGCFTLPPFIADIIEAGKREAALNDQSADR